MDYDIVFSTPAWEIEPGDQIIANDEQVIVNGIEDLEGDLIKVDFYSFDSGYDDDKVFNINDIIQHWVV